MRSSEAVVCDGLVRRFGERDALAGLDLAVEAGADGARHRAPTGPARRRSFASSRRCFARTSGRVAGRRPRPAGLRGRRRRTRRVRRHDPLAYPDLTARENLELYAALYAVPDDRVDEELDRVGLDGRRGDRTAELSRGMLQRLALARIGLHRPSIVLLDEPTAGLDADGRDVLRRFLAEPDRTIVAATHEPAWFAGLESRVVRLDAGRVAA